MLNKFSKDLATIYEHHVLINEVSQKFVDEVKDAVADRELPFQEIFGSAVRIVIPLDTASSDTIISDIITEISKIKDYAGVDLKKGEVVRKIKLDPKYGEGEKEQRVSIGKAIAALKIDQEKKQKFLDFLARYKESLAEKNEYSVVISRNPIDVLRMGELYEMKRKDDRSCHAQGGSFFQCAIQETKTGGGVAYVVKTEDIENLSDEELQYDEIFEDEDRDVSGIKAISRLRIRRYDIVDDDENSEASLAIPTPKTYGKVVPGFYQTVANFLKMRSPTLNKSDYIVSKYKSGNITRYGGSYTDYNNDQMFRNMFPNNKDEFFDDAVNKEDVDEPDPEYDDEDPVDVMERNLQEIEDQYSITHGSHGYDVGDDGDGPYYMPYANVTFEGITFKDNVPYLDIEVERIKRYDPEGTAAWQTNVPHGLTSEDAIALKRFLYKFNTYLPSGVDLDDIESVQFDPNDETVTINLDTSFAGIDISDYTVILDRLESIDEDYEELATKLKISLGVNGFLKTEREDQYVEIEDPEDFAETLKNSKFTPYDNQLLFNIKLGKFDDYYVGGVSQKFGPMLLKYLNKYYKPQIPKESPEQLKFDKFFEAYSNPELYNSYNIESIDTTTIDRYHPLLMINLEIKFYAFNKAAADVSKFLDDNADDVANMLRLLFIIANDQHSLGFFGFADEKIPSYKSTNLYKTYAHLLN
jgi:hypothetical protein